VARITFVCVTCRQIGSILYHHRRRRRRRRRCNYCRYSTIVPCMQRVRPYDVCDQKQNTERRTPLFEQRQRHITRC